ncbi:MAG: hypothetical protein HXY50_09155 [Ignavibacteriaceae bacterium]|nr:hypothetical protein [Ignavibacteriaceae bacterium]
MNSIFLFFLSFIFFCCSDSLTNYYEIELDKEFNLRVGESAVISGYGVCIKFDSVAEDSRCPSELVCIWAGNAKSVFELKNSSGKHQTIYLNTHLEPKQIEFSKLTFYLKELNPYPQKLEFIEQSDYVAKLVVKKKEN